jgi:hypothetical protein
MDSARIAHTIEIMLCGLGEPPRTPPGCSNLLATCFNLLHEFTGTVQYFATFDRASDLCSLWVRFITAPRTEEDIDQLSCDVQTCRCFDQDAPLILSSSPAELHRPREGGSDPNLAWLIDALIVGVVSTLSLVKLSPRLFRTQPTSRAWPTRPDDLLPYGPFVTLRMLEFWSINPESDITLQRVGTLHQNLCDIFGPQLIPGILKTNAGLLYIYRFAARVRRTDSSSKLRISHQRPDEVEHLLASFRQVSTILECMTQLLSSDELLIWLENHSVRSLKDHANCCFWLLDYARTVMGYILQAARTNNMTRTVVDIERTILEHVKRIHLANPFSIDISIIPHGYRGYHRSWPNVGSDPLARLLSTITSYYYSDRRDRCYGPSCLQIDIEDQFKRCAQCKTAIYCSRRCQKRAWTFPGAPHRELCATSWVVCAVQNQVEGTGLPVAFLNERISYDQAKKGVLNIENLHKSQIKVMRECLQMMIDGLNYY